MESIAHSSCSRRAALWLALGLVCLTVQQSSGARILLYPFGHCLNSHLLNAERLSEILASGGHEVDMIVSTAYKSYEHLGGGKDLESSTVKTCEEKEWTCSEDDVCLASKENSTSTEPEKQTNARIQTGTQAGTQSATQGATPGGSVRLLEFPSPPNFVPVCEHDTLDFMLSAPLADRFNSLIDTSVRYCDSLLSSDLLRRLKETDYSLIILESVDPCSRVLADYLDRPFVLLVTTGLGHFDSNPRPPSYLPAAIAPYTTSMNFAQRVMNLILKLMYDRAIPAMMGFMDHFERLKVKHGLNTTLSVDDTFLRASLKLVNSDFSIEYPAPIEPDTILIGGFSVPKPTAMSADLQSFMDGADEHGVIVFSFGTLVKRYSQDWTATFLEVLSRLPQRVVWRYHGNISSSFMSPNIKILKWLPQASLLSHPNTRLFVSHCGLNALFEAAHFGVPVVAIPLSGDQLNNAAKISDHLHMGVRVDIHSMTVESLYQDFLAVLEDPKYTTNARQVASLLRDQPMSAVDRILFWVDYVARHGGAQHLKSAAGALPLYQYLSLDVIFVLFLAVMLLVGILLFCLYKLIRFALRLSVFCSAQFLNKVRVRFAKEHLFYHTQ